LKKTYREIFFVISIKIKSSKTTTSYFRYIIKMTEVLENRKHKHDEEEDEEEEERFRKQIKMIENDEEEEDEDEEEEEEDDDDKVEAKEREDLVHKIIDKVNRITDKLPYIDHYNNATLDEILLQLTCVVDSMSVLAKIDTNESKE
jgi:hypothetical protein